MVKVVNFMEYIFYQNTTYNKNTQFLFLPHSPSQRGKKDITRSREEAFIFKSHWHYKSNQVNACILTHKTTGFQRKLWTAVKPQIITCRNHKRCQSDLILIFVGFLKIDFCWSIVDLHVVLVSAVQQRESVMHWIEFPVLYSRFSLRFCFKILFFLIYFQNIFY